jgi:hypothetical protein
MKLACLPFGSQICFFSMSELTKPFDFSEIVGYLNDIPEDVVDNVLEFHEGGDACTHVKAFWKLIDDWHDSPICEDALMLLFSWTLLEGQGSACDWFLIHKDKSIKTIWDFLHDFLEIFGDDQDEIYNELVDDFTEKWKRKNLQDIDTINSDIEEDTPLDPNKELKEILLNMQWAHAKQFEAMNEQLTTMEARLAEDETYIEYPDPLELELDSEKDEEVYGEILEESMDEPIIHFEEVKELEFENVEYLDDSSPHPPPEEPIFLKDNFENLEENNMMVPVICYFSTS